MRYFIALLSIFMLYATAAVAQSSMRSLDEYEVIYAYLAFIGTDDVYNSSGERLTRPWQVIRQDRANFHRFGIRDDEDQSDSFFSDPGNREAMERMLRDGEISAAAARDVLRPGALIYVEVLGIGDTGYAVRVTTAR